MGVETAIPHAVVAASLGEAPACSNCILLASPIGRRLQALEIATVVSRRPSTAT
jgi:hypothetical protein